MGKRVAVIGAGVSGLTAIKACLEEGLEPVTFERTDTVGGLWNFTDEIREDQACVMRSTIINTSKELSCFSDYPVPKEYPNLMHHTLVLKYFKLYINQFGLERYIRFNHEIIFITRTPDYDVTGQWNVTYKDHNKGDDATEVTERFDGVLICTGHHASKNMPTFQGMESFKGRIMHSLEYKDPKGLEQKNVVVVGIGNSGVDVATDLSKIAKQVYMAARKGVWLRKKGLTGNMPWDVIIQRRVRQLIGKLLGPQLMADIYEKEANEVINHKLFGLQPKHRIFAAPATANDDIPYAILTGQVVVKCNIKEIKETSVVFEDNTEVDADAIIMATGYNFGFPFVDKKVLEVKNNKIDLYKFMFPPDLKHGTLAIIGCFQPVGSAMPIMEIQSRWAARTIKGKCTLPPSEDMRKDIQLKQKLMRSRYADNRLTIQVDYIPYMDELAEQVGCKPNIGKLMASDPRLAFHMYFGPCVPYQYRLVGPHSWPGARYAILTTMERVECPFKTREPEGTKAEGFWTMDRIKLAIFLAFLLLLNMLFLLCVWVYV